MSSNLQLLADIHQRTTFKSLTVLVPNLMVNILPPPSSAFFLVHGRAAAMEYEQAPCFQLEQVMEVQMRQNWAMDMEALACAPPPAFKPTLLGGLCSYHGNHNRKPISMIRHSN
jgi:hypothetical protein